MLLALTVTTHVLAFAGLQLNAATSECAPLAILAAPFAYNLCKFAFANHTVPAAIKPLKTLALRWHMAMTAALLLALCTSGVALHGAGSLA